MPCFLRILPLKKDFEKAVETLQNTQVASAPNVVSLLERAEMFLEDGKWDSAEEYCERVLDIEPKKKTEVEVEKVEDAAVETVEEPVEKPKRTRRPNRGQGKTKTRKTSKTTKKENDEE